MNTEPVKSFLCGQQVKTFLDRSASLAAVKDAPSLVHSTQRELRAEIARRGSTMAAMERALDLGSGYMSQVLSGKIDLKLLLVFQILDELGSDYAKFFGAILGQKVTGEQLRYLAARRNALAGGAATNRPADELDVAEEEPPYDVQHARIERLVVEEIEKVLGGTTVHSFEERLRRLEDQFPKLAG